MKRFGLALLVASSLLTDRPAAAANRPRYGGTLHLALSAAPASLDPAEAEPARWLVLRNLWPLVFDRLVTLDDQGEPQAALAASWQADANHQRWDFHLRSGVTFSDGSPLTPVVVASSLRAANPSWRVFPNGDSVIVERDAAALDLPAELALPRNSIAKRDGGKLTGTGPFVITGWEPGKKLTLAAREDDWAGRPFLDAIEVDFGQSPREQMIGLDLDKTQLIDIPAEQAQHALAEARRVQASEPIELMALLFSRDRQSPEEGRQRSVLSLGIDRGSLNRVVLQNGGEPAGGLLPAWMTGYGFVFPVSVNLEEARLERTNIPHATAWTLGYDPGDRVARVVAERIALNARDAGLTLQLTGGGAADLRLVRVPIASLDAHVALRELAASLGLPPPRFESDSVDALYAAEDGLLESERVIPLLHLRSAAGVEAAVRGFHPAPDGSWRLPEVWLAAGKP
jgi:peptide/nickel transport system substrate-binding protein